MKSYNQDNIGNFNLFKIYQTVFMKERKFIKDECYKGKQRKL